MSTVVSMLEGRSDVDELVMDRDLYDDELRFKPLRKQYNQILRRLLGEKEPTYGKLYELLKI